MRTFLRTLKLMCLMMAVVVWPATARAQFQDISPIKIEPAEEQRLQAVLASDIPADVLNTKKIELHKQKELAAAKLGDSAAREKNLREWGKIDEEGLWVLRSFLANTDKRAESYEIGNAIIRKSRWPIQAARMKIFMADTYIDDGDLTKANNLLTEAEVTLRTSSRSTPNSEMRYVLGDTDVLQLLTRSKYFMRVGKFSDAIAVAKLAVDKSTQQIRQEDIANERHRFMGRNNALRVRYMLSIEQSSIGEYSESEASLREAYQMARQFGFNENLMSLFYVTVADLYNATGQYIAALDFAQRSENIVLQAGLPKGSLAWINTQLRANVALAGLDKWHDALINLDRMDQALKEAGLQDTLASQTEVRGLIYLRNQQFEKARDFLQGQMKWSQDNLGLTHQRTALLQGLLASALSAQNEHDAARELFEQSIKIMSAPEALTGDVRETAILLKTKRHVLQSYAKLLARKASTNREDAQTLFKIADQLNSSTVQQALIEAAVRAGVTIPGLADIIRKEQDAKNEIETLTSYIRGQDIAEQKNQTPQIVEQMRTRLRELEQIRKSYKAQIQKEFPEYFQLIQPRSPAPAEISAKLKPDELFISVIPLEDQTFVWAIDAQGGIQFHQSSLTETELRTLVERMRKTLDVAELGDKAPAFDYASAHRLYQGLISPFDGEIDTKKHIVFSASGALAKLPYAVLLRQPYSGTEPTAAPWLIKSVAVSHVPNASGWISLKRFGQTKVGPEPLMAWGDPLFDPKAVRQMAQADNGPVVRATRSLRSTEQTKRDLMNPNMFMDYNRLPTLPETRDEVLELAKILSANPKEDVLLGAQATRKSVLEQSASGKLAQKQVLVFATHGLLAGDLPNLNQPALAMAGTIGQGETPLLTLDDVLGLKLNAEWVVLSACNTAGADGRAEEALSGLARGFFYAGSRSLLVTHWSVESESAMQLTTHTFSAYKNLATLRRAEALQQAMLETMKTKRFSHPAYWAPYALIGEGGR